MKAHTATQKQALAALIKAGGSGVIDKAGHVLAGGEVLGTLNGHSPFSAATWLRLLLDGSLEPEGPNRIRVAGKKYPTWGFKP